MSHEHHYQECFRREEAESKVGKQVRSAVRFFGVPEGSTGLVVQFDLAEWTKLSQGQIAEVFDVAIQWNLPLPEPSAELIIPLEGEPYVHIRAGKLLVDWFTKDEYEWYLDELPTEADDPKATTS